MTLKLECIDVLVVEDNPFMRSILKGILSSLGVNKVDEAENGTEALQLLQGGSAPDILVTDWMMPEMDGIQLVRKIRSDPESKVPFMPVIMLTAFSEYENVIQARDAGINEFLAKPVSVKGLISRIESVIYKPRHFIRTPLYFGPCRRRRDMPFECEERRTAVDLSLELGEDFLPPGMFDEPQRKAVGETPSDEWTINEFSS